MFVLQKQMTHEEIFTSIYSRCYWGTNQDKKYKGSSGQGSALQYNKITYIPFLKAFIREHNIQTVVDLGCGDFRCGPTIYDDLDIKYHGYDAYKSLIDKHSEEIISPKYSFYHLDFFGKKEEILSGDICILKDVLQHWSTNDIYIFLDYLIETKKFKYILITNCSHQKSVDGEINTGDYRPLTCEELPLKKYGAIQQIKWDTKEVSLITLEECPSKPIKRIKVMQSTANANQAYTEREQMIQFWVRQLDEIVEKEGEDLEGNCFYHGNTRMTSWFFLYKKINFVNILLDNNVKKMVEIGFNAGHSGVVFLSALPKDGSILFFDLNDHKYAKPCYTLLKESFPQVKDFIAGDSRETIKQYLQENPNEKGTFDCVHVDGGHSKEIALSDVAFSDFLLRKGGIMILDDTQLKDIENLIPMLLENKYTFVYQIPTYGFSHVCLMKN